MAIEDDEDSADCCWVVVVIVIVIIVDGSNVVVVGRRIRDSQEMAQMADNARAIITHLVFLPPPTPVCVMGCRSCCCWWCWHEYLVLVLLFEGG